jgi:hypothetical protein
MGGGSTRGGSWEVFNFEWRMVASFESLLKFIVYIKVSIIQKCMLGTFGIACLVMESLGIVIKLFVQMIKGIRLQTSSN